MVSRPLSNKRHGKQVLAMILLAHTTEPATDFGKRRTPSRLLPFERPTRKGPLNRGVRTERCGGRAVCDLLALPAHRGTHTTVESGRAAVGAGT